MNTTIECFLTGLLATLQMFLFLSVASFENSSKINQQFCVPYRFQKPHWNFNTVLSKNTKSWFCKSFSNILENIGSWSVIIYKYIQYGHRSVEVFELSNMLIFSNASSITMVWKENHSLLNSEAISNVWMFSIYNNSFQSRMVYIF